MDYIKDQSKDETFENLFTEHYKNLFLIAFTKTRNYHDAQDAVQDTFYLAYKCFDQLKHPEYFKTWVTRILLNCINKYYITIKKRKVMHSEMEDAIQNSQTETSDDEMILADALRTLDKKHCDVILLRYFVDYTVPEIAKALDIPEGTVKSRLARGLEKLKKYFGQDKT